MRNLCRSPNIYPHRNSPPHAHALDQGQPPSSPALFHPSQHRQGNKPFEEEQEKEKAQVNNKTKTPGHNNAAYEATTAVPSLVASAHGVVLELGPGAGTQLGRFTPERVEHVYGVEPNTAFSPGFADRLRAARLGQDGKYTLIPCGVEDGESLARFGVVEGSVDCVVSMQVLVSFWVSHVPFAFFLFSFDDLEIRKWNND